MKQILFFLAACFISVNALSFTPEVKIIKLNDGEEIKGRLCLPDNEVKTIVFCIPGTGTNTFDKDNDKRISKEEYEHPDEQLALQRGYLFQNMPFDSLDVVNDAFIDVKDIQKMRAPFHDYLMKCVLEDNYQWIRNNYFNITPQWFKSHFRLEPNKTRLLRINIPIHIFHGENDANVSVESVLDIKSRFDVCNKTNLRIYVFEKHNHDLNFMDLLSHKQWSEGFKTIFRVAKGI